MIRTLRPGDWVRVRNKDEILGTLAADGTFEGLMFMPEMLQFCGQRLRVFKRAHKSCDYTTPQPYRSRRLKGTVLLEARCDGTAHGGCQAGCTLLWKEAWLSPAEIPNGRPGGQLHAGTTPIATSSALEESVLWQRTQSVDPEDGSPRYFCQATEIRKASEPLAWWDVRQYVEDYRSGNVSLRAS